MDKSVSGEIVVATPAIVNTVARTPRHRRRMAPNLRLTHQEHNASVPVRSPGETAARWRQPPATCVPHHGHACRPVFTAHQGFIHFHLTAQAIAIGRTIAVRSGAASSTPSGRSRSPTGAEASWPRPHSSPRSCTRPREPNRQRCASAVEDRPAVTDTRRLQRSHQNRRHSSANSGWFRSAANETVWPAQPIEIVQTGVIIGKPCAQFGIVTRVIVTALESRGRKLLRHTYILCLPHSDGHPLLNKYVEFTNDI